MLIIGAGPAGLAPLFAAASSGRLTEVLDSGVTVVERGHSVGAGGLASCGIRSDSSAEAFLDIVTRTAEPRLLRLREHPAGQALIALGKGDAPLSLVADFLRVAGEVMTGLVAASERGSVVTGSEAVWVQRTRRGDWRTRIRCIATGTEQEFDSKSVVLATGAHQPLERLYQEPVAGMPLLPRFGHKLVQSGSVLAKGGVEAVAARLRGIARPKVVIVGGSTSAGAVAVALLGNKGDLDFAPGGLTLMHRQPLRIFYESAAAALQDGYTEFMEQDICSLTGRVFRFSGFRFTSRDLIMRARKIAGSESDPRLSLLRLLPQSFAEAQRELDNADLIVAAMGYRPKLLPVRDANGETVEVHTPDSRNWSVVDSGCRVLTAQSHPLEGLYALGLAVGPHPGVELGGEANFKGQVNSLWMWQHMLGKRIFEQALAEGDPARADRASVPHLLPVRMPATPTRASVASITSQPALVMRGAL